LIAKLFLTRFYPQQDDHDGFSKKYRFPAKLLFLVLFPEASEGDYKDMCEQSIFISNTIVWN
jgi:hypothetical protein